MSNAALEGFAVFILTNGRPDRVFTYSALRKSGYTGRIVVLVDNLDPTVPEYVKKFGDEVVVFDKESVAKTFDRADNFEDLRSTNYARNVSFSIAERLGIKYFIQLDDDYLGFQFRFNQQLDYEPKTNKKLDATFAALLKFFKSTPILSIALAQGGDFIGGEEAAPVIQLKRKCMNSFICSPERKFTFVGRLNEDVNTYVNLGSRGLLFFTATQVNLNQKQTQTNAGGMTEAYKDFGTYVKSFYTVIFQPSSVKVRIMTGKKYQRLHHHIAWKFTVPKILRESVKRSA